MKSRTIRFTPAEQGRFARLSGDVNPIHVDPVAARRIAAGEPIVHGMHAVLRAVDELVTRTAASTTISARFERPILVGELVQLTKTASDAIAFALDDGLPLVTVRLERTKRDPSATPIPDGNVSPSPRLAQPRVWTIADIGGAAGVIGFTPSKALTRQFPRATRAFGTHAIAAIAAISRLIGMECPGRNSLIAGVSLRVHRGDDGRRLHWRVARVDSRFGLVGIAVNGGGLHGTVDVFVRPAAVAPASWPSAAAAVAPNVFAGQRALVIGGSRGLGAATAQLVIAGGGACLATFAAGSDEATTLRRTVARAGRRLEIARLDVTRDATGGFSRVCKRFRPTHLYYFATPRIFGRRRDPFDAERFRTFADVYVSGFATVCRAALEATPLALTVFYPSTTTLDSVPARELTEYAAAKAAGESVCASLNASTPRLRIHVKRLPRTATDQTASVLPVPAADPIAVMVPILRELHRDQGRTA
jgi:NADP-dependent 3-hydroxy acid dehydrogenase YdfG